MPGSPPRWRVTIGGANQDRAGQRMGLARHRPRTVRSVPPARIRLRSGPPAVLRGQHQRARLLRPRGARRCPSSRSGCRADSGDGRRRPLRRAQSARCRPRQSAAVPPRRAPARPARGRRNWREQTAQPDERPPPTSGGGLPPAGPSPSCGLRCTGHPPPPAAPAPGHQPKRPEKPQSAGYNKTQSYYRAGKLGCGAPAGRRPAPAV